MKDLIFHNPRRTYFSLSEEELDQLEAASNVVWKDLALICFSVSVTSIPNAAAELNSEEFSLSLGLFLNSLFGVVTLLLGLGFSLAWKRAARRKREVLKKLRDKRPMGLTLALPAVPGEELPQSKGQGDASGVLVLEEEPP